MDPTEPVAKTPGIVAELETQHAPPPRREVDDLAHEVPVPQSVVGGRSGKGVTLFAPPEGVLRLGPFRNVLPESGHTSDKRKDAHLQRPAGAFAGDRGLLHACGLARREDAAK